MKIKENIKPLFAIASLLLLLGILVYVYINYTNKEKQLIFCDFENFKTNDKSVTYSTNNIFKKIKVSIPPSSEYAYSGSNSLHITTQEYVNLVTINNVKQSEAYSISILRKGGSARIIVQEDVENPDMYHSTMFAIDTFENEWGKLQVQFRTPPNYSGNNIKVYIWNPEKTSSYLDDLKVEQIEYIEFPEYTEIPSLNIFIENIEIKKLNKIKNNAFDRGILVSDNDSYINGIVVYEDKMMEAEIRFKGDWLDRYNRFSRTFLVIR